MRKFKKQINYRKSFTGLFLLSILMLFVAAILETYGVSLIDSAAILTPTLAGCSMTMVGNLEGTCDRDSAGAQICMKIYLIHRNQLDPASPFPVPDANGELGTIPLKTGEKMYYFTAINDSQEDKSTGTKGDVTTEVINSFMFIVGGNKQKAIQFMEDFAGEGFIIIYQMADDRQWYILGTDLKPMFLQSFERMNNKTQRSVTLTFQNSSFMQVKKYTGTIINALPVSLAANATSIPFTTSDSYITSDKNTAESIISAFTGLATNDVGRFVTINGGGGENPTKIAADVSIVLKNEETWTGTAGSTITFKVLDTSTLVEMSRVQRA